MASAFIKVAFSNSAFFSNAQNYDMLIYPSLTSQRILLGNSNSAATLLVDSNYINVAGDINFSGGLYQNGVPFTSGGGGGDLGTGIGFSTGVGCNLYILGSNIGIGKFNPAATLDVQGNVNITNNLSLGGSVAVQGLSIIRNTGHLANVINPTITATGPFSNDGLGLNLLASNNTSNNYFKFLASNTEVLRITGNSLVGVGNSNPKYAMDVIGDINFTGILRNSNVPYISSQWSNSAANVFLMSSNVGIGKMNPMFPLDVAGDINFGGVLRQGGVSYIGSQWSNNSNNIFLIGSNVGLGKSNPQATLDIAGSLNVSSNFSMGGSVGVQGLDIIKNIGGMANITTSSIVGVSNDSNGLNLITTCNYIRFLASNTELARFTGGNLGIKKNNPIYPLDVAGDLNFDGILRKGGVPYVGSQWSNNSSNVFLMSSNVGIGKMYPVYPLDVAGDLNFDGILRQSGVPYVGSQWSNNFSNVFLMSSNVGIGKMYPQATLDIVGTLNVSSNVAIGGSLTICNSEIINSNLTVLNNSILSNNLYVYGATSLSNTLNVSGATTFSNSLYVTGASTRYGSIVLSNTLNVSGATMLANSLYITGASVNSNTTLIYGTTSLSNTLNVSGSTILSNTLNVSGATTFYGITSLSNAVGISSNLSVKGPVSSLGILTGNGLTSTGAITATNQNISLGTGAVTCGTLTVTGNATNTGILTCGGINIGSLNAGSNIITCSDIILNGQSLLSLIASRYIYVSAAALASCYSVRAIINSYTGPVVQIRRGLDNLIVDFYADATQTNGELWTTMTLGVGSGTTLTNWLGTTSAGYITKWYDQSGKGNHAINLTNSGTQPTIVKNCGYWVVYWVSSNATVLNITTPIRPNTVVSQFLNTNAWGSIVTTETNYGHVRTYPSAILAGNAEDWYYSSVGEPKLAYVNGLVASMDNNMNGKWTSMALSTVTGTSTSFNRISDNGRQYVNAYPPVTLTGWTTNVQTAIGVYDNGTYIISCSAYAHSGLLPYYAFIVPSTGERWTTYGYSVNATPALYTGGTTTTSIAGAAYLGEWVQIQLPFSILLKSHYMSPFAVGTVYLLGSTNGENSSWTLLSTSSLMGWTATTTTVSTPVMYSYYRWVIGSGYGTNSNGTVGFYSLILNGIPMWQGQSSLRGVDGYMTEIYFHSQVLRVADMTAIYANRLSLAITAFPPAVMTANTTIFPASAKGGTSWTTDGGTYIASVSSSYSDLTLGAPWIVFNPGAGWYGGWTEAANNYTGVNGTYAGSVTTAGYLGEYIQLQCPLSVYLTGYSVTASTLISRSPKDFVLLGSADGGITWTLLDSRTGITGYTAGIPLMFSANQTISAAYSIFRLVVTKNNGADSWLSIYGLKFYGYPGAPNPSISTPLPSTMYLSTLNYFANLNTTFAYALSYTATVSPIAYQGAITINSGNILMMQGNYRNAKYAVTVSAINSIGSISQTINVIEPMPPIAIPSGCQGLYSLYLLSDAYVGPVVNCRRSSDSVTSDFYNIDGQLCTSSAGTTSISTWLGAGIAYVTIWYDQSGSGNHATMTTAASQPSINLTTMRVAFANSQYLSMPDGTIPYGNSMYTVTVKHGAINAVAGQYGYGVWGSGGYGTTDGTLALSVESGTYNNYWWADDIITGSYATKNVVTCKYDQSSRYVYVNGVLSGTKTNTAVRNSLSTNNTIGVTQSLSFWLNGELDYLAIFADSLSDQSRLAVEGLYSTTPMSPVLNFDANTLVSVGAGNVISSWPNNGGLLGTTFAATAYNSPLAGSVTAASVAYPPFAMTAYSCSPGRGTYVASASSDYSPNGRLAWRAFDNTTNWWSTSTTSYAANGSYTGSSSTTVDGTAYAGEWLQFKMPFTITCASYSFSLTSNAGRLPSTWAFAGSVDGSLWVLLDAKTDQTTTASTTYTFVVSGMVSAFSHFRIVIRSIVGSGTVSEYASIQDFHVYAAPVRYHAGFVSANSQYFNITKPLPMTWFNNSGVYAGMTVFFVAQFTDTASPGVWERFIDFANGPNMDNILIARNGTSSWLSTSIANGNIGRSVVDTQMVIIPSDGAFHLYVINITNSAAGNTLTMYVDGTVNGATQSGATPITNRTTVNNYIGKSNWPDAYLSANMRLFQMFDRSLSATEMALAYRVLATKWGMFNDGSTPQRAAVSAAAIKELTGTNANGYYWLRANNIPLTQTYCIQNVPIASSLSGLVNYWSFDNNNTTDSVRSVVLTATGSPTYLTGRTGNMITFANNVSGVSTSQHLDGTLSNPTGNMTLSVWIYPRSLPPNGALSAITNMGALRILLNGTTSGAVISGWFCDSTVLWTSITTTSLVQSNAWSHVVFVYNTTVQSLYLNGVLVGTMSVNGSLNSGATNISVGWDTVASRGFQGNIDELALYGRALSTTEVTYLSATTTYPPAAMTGNTTTMTGLTYGNGTYVASASTILGTAWDTYLAFSLNPGLFWHSTVGVYTGGYTGGVSTTVDGVVVLGEWLQLTMPLAIRIDRYSVSPRILLYSIRSPVNFVLAGSTDGTTWTKLDQRTGVTWTTSSQLFDATLKTYTFSYFRIITTNIGGTNTDSVQIADMRFYTSLQTFNDGSTAARAGTSAVSIKALTGTNTNGIYWIDFPTVGPTQVYCIMDIAQPAIAYASPSVIRVASPTASDGLYWLIMPAGIMQMYCIMSIAQPAIAYASPSAIRAASPAASDGDYYLMPAGQPYVQCYVNFTNSPTVDKAWVLIQRGRESLTYWTDAGQNTSTGLIAANIGINTPVANASSAWVNALTGGWHNTQILLNRSMTSDSFTYNGTMTGTFSWSYFTWLPSPPVTVNVTRYPQMWGKGPSTHSVLDTYGWLDIGETNDSKRSFTWTWDAHGGYQGYSHGNTGIPTAGFQNSSEGHPITLANVYVLCGPAMSIVGLSAANAGTSAASIKALTGTNTNGYYWILVAGVPTLVYCGMNAFTQGNFETLHNNGAAIVTTTLLTGPVTVPTTLNKGLTAWLGIALGSSWVYVYVGDNAWVWSGGVSPAMPAGAGANYLVLQTTSGGTAGIIQAFSVIPGKTYALNFYYGSRVAPYGANTLTVQFDDGTAGTFGAPIWTKAIADGQTWQSASVSFTPSQSSVRIQIASTAANQGMAFLCKMTVDNITYQMIKEVVDTPSTGPYTITWSEIATTLNMTTLTNCTFRIFTMLRDSTSSTQHPSITLDYKSWNGSSFTINSFSGQNNDFCQLVTVVNTNDVYTITQILNFGYGKTTPFINASGVNVYTPWGDGSGNYRFVFYAIPIGTFTAFPPIALTAASTSTSSTTSTSTSIATVSGQAYGNGTYAVSCSIGFNPGVTGAGFTYSPYVRPIVDQNFCTSQVYGGGAGGIYTGSATTAGYAGEWCQIQFPTPLVVTYLSIACRTTQGTSEFQIFRSIDGVTWVALNLYTGNTNTTWGTVNAPVTFQVTNTNPFAFYRVVFGKGMVGNNGGFMCINALQFYCNL